MKQNKFFIYILAAVFCSMSLFTACEDDEKVVIPVSSCKIDLGQTPDKIAELEADTKLEVPITITSEKGVKSAFYKVVTKPVDKLVVGAQTDLPLNGNKVETTIKIRITSDLNSIVFAAFDADGVIVYRTVTIDAIKIVDHAARQLKDVQISTDPADNKCFVALYEATPIFGKDVALTKQSRIDWVVTKNGSAIQPIVPHAYGAGASYYTNSLPYLTGFTELTYGFISAIRGKIVKSEFDALNTDNDLRNYVNTRISGPAPDGENYNVRGTDRRVGDTFNTTNKATGGFIFGWGSRNHPTASTAGAVNTAFGFAWVKSVTQKANGHYIMTLDIKYPSYDEREANNKSSIAPYSPYPL